MGPCTKNLRTWLAFCILTVIFDSGSYNVLCRNNINGPQNNNNNNNRPNNNNNNRHFIEERNKKLVVEFYQSFFGDKNIQSVDKYIDGRSYIQHNPTLADGRDALKEAAKGWFSGTSGRKERVDIRRISAEKDLVWLHIKNGNNAVVEIFRVNGRGKIVEHWDVIQQIPTSAVNSHPMF